MRATMATSEKMKASAIARRTYTPLVFLNSREPNPITLEPHQFKKLNVDETYQRIEIKSEINDLIHVLQAGGCIPDPVTVAERQDGSWWIVDGQQRFWAHEATEKPLRCEIWKVESLDEERTLFQLMNTNRTVRPDFLVHSWPGISGDFIRGISADKAHPFFQNINFGKNHSLPYGASIVMRAVLLFLGGRSQNVVTRVMALLDRQLADVTARKKARQFLDLLCLANPPRQRLRYIAALALAAVARRRWEKEWVPMPSRCAMAIQKINWENALPSNSLKFLPLAESVIDTKWKRVA
jgi:hypothetical protein